MGYTWCVAPKQSTLEGEKTLGAWYMVNLHPSVSRNINPPIKLFLKKKEMYKSSTSKAYLLYKYSYVLLELCSQGYMFGKLSCPVSSLFQHGRLVTMVLYIYTCVYL